MEKQAQEFFTWKDTETIVQKLFEKYPDVVPAFLSTEELCKKVRALEGFKEMDFPKSRSSIDDYVIKRDWSDLRHDGPAAKNALERELRELAYLADVCP